MIIYFSATGNSLYVARHLAAEGERLISIPEALDQRIYEYDLEPGEKVGVISPTYNWTLPSVVSEYLEQLRLHYESRPYTYYVGTYGTTTGAAAEMANDYMKAAGCPFDAMFDIKMPDTWTPIYDLSNKEHVAEIIRKADAQIAELQTQIAARVTGKHMDITMPCAAGVIGREIYDRRTRRTSNLTVEDTCIGCGLCARKCPVHAIEMQNGRPVWIKDHCAMCLGCLHRCPRFAIQCGSRTRQHGQYQHSA